MSPDPTGPHHQVAGALCPALGGPGLQVQESREEMGEVWVMGASGPRLSNEGAMLKTYYVLAVYVV